MTARRDKKKHEKKASRDRLRSKKWAPFAAVLTALGFGELNRRLPDKAREWLLEPPRNTAPEVVAGDGAQEFQHEEAIRGRIKDVFDGASDPSAPDLTVSAFMSAGLTLARSLANAAAFFPKDTDLMSLTQEAAEAVVRFRKAHHREILCRVTEEIDLIIAEYTSVKVGYPWARLELVEDTDDIHTRVTVGFTRGERDSVSVDGRPRPAYRCGFQSATEPFRWMTGLAEEPGLGGRDRCNVYVQQHALDQLHERVPLANRGLVEMCMLASLDSPEYAHQTENKALVEFRIAGKKLGYLVTTRLPDRVLVRTFLFLTMQGTPESRLLRDRLKLQRPDIDHLGLDRLETLTLTDIRDDPELVASFRSCGLGHLFDLFDLDDATLLRRGKKREVRDYLAGPNGGSF
jgi:hypothetical protein